MKSVRTTGCAVVVTLFFGAAAQSQTREKQTDKRFLIVLVGPAGSGKTAQAEFLRKRFGIPAVAVDDLIQANPGAPAQLDVPASLRGRRS